MKNKQIKNAVTETMEKYDPLLTSKKSALLMYAKEESIEVDLFEEIEESIQINNIVPEMQSVDIEKKVRRVNKFEYNDKDTGKKKEGCRFELIDDTGVITMMLWGDDVEKVSEDMEDDTVRVEDAYTKMYEGDVQLNYGDSTKISRL